ncbi:MAG: prepilin-type N-terminal cleavage/methylation domain-containing protein, partial [Candidatus Dadabacteria bacterium]
MSGHKARGFTLVELVIAVTLMALLSLALYGVISVGARAASAAERRTEQARRLRVATNLIVRQLHAVA